LFLLLLTASLSAQTTPRSQTALGAGLDGLFKQVKENAIIEVLSWYWWYEGRNDLKGAARTIERLKRILNT